MSSTLFFMLAVEMPPILSRLAFLALAAALWQADHRPAWKRLVTFGFYLIRPALAGGDYEE